MAFGPPLFAQTAPTPSESLLAALPTLCAGAGAAGALATRCAELRTADPAAFAVAARAQRLEELPGHARVGDLHGEEARPAATSPDATRAAWDLWASAVDGALDRRDGRIEAGFDAGRDALLVGASWRPDARLTVDGGWQWARETLDYRGSDGVLRARMDGPLLLVAWAPGPTWRVEAQADRVSGTLRSARRVRYALPGGASVDAEASAAARTTRQGLGLALRRSDAIGAWSIDSGVAMDESKTRIAAYRESGGAGWALSVPARERRSRRALLEATLSRAVSRPSGVWLPSLRLAQVREFADPTRTLGVRFVDDPSGQVVRFATEEPDCDWSEAAAGLVWLRPGGASLFIEARQRIGHRFLDERQVALGFRLEH
jgi:hypothetical protein